MQQERESAELCTNGCGFFGNAASGGMCSVCWKKTMSNRQVETKPKVPSSETSSVCVVETNQSIAASAAAASSSSSTIEVDPDVSKANEASPVAITQDVEEKPVEKLEQKNKKRCWECKKKVGLTAIECRCGYVFCSAHRYADQHSCTFDFKASDRAELARRNPGGGQFGKLEKL